MNSIYSTKPYAHIDPLQYIATKLLEINERGTYRDPDSIPASDSNRDALLLAQEEDLFQTARLINCM